MYTPEKEHLTQNARSLRKAMTKEERHLWYDFLRGLPVKVHRQKVIGNYIADFYVASQKIIIELDGSQHFEQYGQIADIARDRYFSELGITVLRYPNSEVNRNFAVVCQDIWIKLGLPE